MSYNFNVNGHFDMADPQAAMDGEFEVLKDAREAVRKLEGVTSSQWASQHYGSLDLLNDDLPEQRYVEEFKPETSDET